MADSRSRLASSSSSRPFLNLLNPMGRHYKGYSPAGRLLEQDEDEEGAPPEHDSTLLPSTSRRVPFGAASNLSNVAQSFAHYGHDNDDNDSSDGEVPQSFMIEAGPRPAPPITTKRTPPRASRPTGRTTSSILPMTAAHTPQLSIPPRPSDLTAPAVKRNDDVPAQTSMRGLDAYERALWSWVNVFNLDEYLRDVYSYYEGKGIYCIALARVLNLMTVGFVISFSTFLLGCVDYARLRADGTKHLSDVVFDRCVSRFSGWTLLCFVVFGSFFVWQVASFGLGFLRLLDMYRFYTYLLNVPDADIQTIAWPEIVRRIGAIRESNPLTAMSSNPGDPDYSPPTAKLDAHDIANRILRQENYLIALFNKELLDFRVPLPPLIQPWFRAADDLETKKAMLLTKALEWNLRFCLLGYLFDESGRVRKVFLKDKNRAALVAGLRRRFIFMGILNAIFVPFIVLYLVMYSFFRYFEEYHKNPSSIGGRKYTPFAEWKFREFNELPHLFTRRLDTSYPISNMYINQFPKERLALIMRFVAFIAGSFAAVLIVASIVDPDLFLNFEITPHRTVLFYIGVFGSILAVARGMVPDENRVFDPEVLMRDVIRYTHYMPADWKGQLHSQKVHQEFGKLFDMKISIFFQELVSVAVTPFILWYSLPPCAPAIVEFFREFTVHVEGLGFVCSFAEFNFKRHGNVNFGAPTEVQDERLLSKEGKMEKSFLNFKAAHPDWNPTDPSGSIYLSRMADVNANLHGPSARSGSHGRKLDSADMVFGYGQHPPNVPGTHTAGQRSLVERAHDYDRALQQSMSAATARRRPAATQPVPHVQGLQRIPSSERTDDGGIGSELGESYVDDLRTRDGQLVDRGVADASMFPEQEQREVDELADGGMVGLLAQIYGRQRML